MDTWTRSFYVPKTVEECKNYVLVPCPYCGTWPRGELGPGASLSCWVRHKPWHSHPGALLQPFPGPRAYQNPWEYGGWIEIEEDWFSYPNFGWLYSPRCSILVRGLGWHPVEQRVLLGNAVWPGQEEEALGILSGNILWICRYNRDHRNTSLSVTFSLLPISGFGCLSG